MCTRRVILSIKLKILYNKPLVSACVEHKYLFITIIRFKLIKLINWNLGIIKGT